jgi:hypothetical protein
LVELVKDGETVATPVKTGLTNGTWIEITEGLTEGDQVVLAASSSSSSSSATQQLGGMRGLDGFGGGFGGGIPGAGGGSRGG